MNQVKPNFSQGLNARLEATGHMWYAEGLVSGQHEGHLSFTQVLARLQTLTKEWNVVATDQELTQFIRDHADNPRTAGFVGSQPEPGDVKYENPRTNGKRRGSSPV